MLGLRLTLETGHYAVARPPLIEEAVVSASRPSHRVRLAATALFAGVAALGAVSACSAGQVSQTAREVPSVPGANADFVGPGGIVALRDMVVVYNGPQGYPQGGAAPMVIRIINNGTSTLTLTKVTAGDAADSVTLVGAAGATPTVTPVPTISTTGATPSGSVLPSGSAIPSGSVLPSGSATPSGSALPSGSPSPSAVPTKPTGQTNFSIDITPASYVLLVPDQGPYLQLNGLKAPLIPGQSVTLTFTFAGGISGQATIPVGVPQFPQPRLTPVAPHVNEQPPVGVGGE